MGEKKATGEACGFAINKQSHARLPRQRQGRLTSQEIIGAIHAFDIKVFFAVRQNKTLMCCITLRL
jgi:hypothetical protein